MVQEFLQTWFTLHDILFGVAFFVVLTAHFIFVEVKKIYIDILAVYLSYLFLVAVPLLMPSLLDLFQEFPFSRPALFVLSIIGLHTAMWKPAPQPFLRGEEVYASDILLTAMYRLTMACLIFSTVLILSPQSFIENFSEPIQLFFANPFAVAILFVLPLVMGIVSSRFDKRSRIRDLRW